MKPSSELLFGYHSVLEAMKAGKRSFETILISRQKPSARTEQIFKLAEKMKIPVQQVSSEKLEKMTQGGNHQGFAAKASGFPTQNANQVISRFAESETPYFILILENIEDPRNLGALIRTALCAGVDSIFVPKDRACHPSPTVSRSSSGAMEHADICIMTNTASILKELKSVGFWVSGLDGEGDQSIYDADLTGHLALIVGGEHKGIRPLVKKGCDFLLSIPNLGQVNSLNASVAGSIAMYEAVRQRR